MSIRRFQCMEGECASRVVVFAGFDRLTNHFRTDHRKRTYCTYRDADGTYFADAGWLEAVKAAAMSAARKLRILR